MALLRKRFLRAGPAALLALVLGLPLLAPPAARAAEHAAVASAEYQIKAVFLFNFCQFVDWPANPAAAGTPFVIGIIGDDPFGSYLDETVAGEKVGNRRIVVRRFRQASEAAGCQVLFVNRTYPADLGKLMESLKGQPVLTVGDADNFNRAGGIIRLVIQNGKIAMHIDVDAASAANVKISSKLLRMATLVGPGRADP